MERVISPEERIRRAEEIYYRRKNQDGTRVLGTSVNIENENKVSLGKKMIIQILICICIYSVFGVLKNSKNIFSDNVINHTKTVLSYDVNLPQVYNQCKEYFNGDFNKIIKTNILNKDFGNEKGEENTNSDNINNSQNQQNDLQQQEQNQEDQNQQEQNQQNQNTQENQNTENSQANPQEQQNQSNQENNQSEQDNQSNLGIRRRNRQFSS